MAVDSYESNVRNGGGEPIEGELLGAGEGPIPVSPEGHLEMLRLLSRWMDSAFEVPGLGWRFGLDPLIGLFPVFGDLITSFISLYILAVAQHYQIPRSTKLRMGLNIAIDYVVGAIPILGNFFDFAWKANDLNLKLLERSIAAAGPRERAQQNVWDWLIIGGIAVVLLVVLIGSLALSILLAQAFLNLFR
jgi:hypothetical protein